MSPSLQAAIESARAREVPWNAERSARIERGIASRRARWATSARFTRWALGGLASVVLYASLLHVSGASREPLVSREPGVSEHRLQEPEPLSAAPSAGPPEEPPLGERPVGDGGFE
jgi:hypothetical protein